MNATAAFENREALRTTLKAVDFAELPYIEVYDYGMTTTAHRLLLGGLQVTIYPTDGGRVDLHVFGDRGILRYAVNFGNAPDAVIEAALLAATEDA